MQSGVNFLVRILYVESAYGFGGSLTGLLHLFPALPKDIEPMLITSFDPSPYVELPSKLIHRQVDIPARPKHPGHWLPGLWDYYRYDVRPWTQSIVQAIADFQPDIIHANNSATVNLGAGLAGRRRGIPTISHQKHFEYPGRLCHWILKRSCYTYHIATSDAVAADMQKLGLDSSRCRRIYEPVQGPTDAQLASRTIHDVPVVAMHSMLVHWKGQHVFLEAVAELRRRNRAPFRAVIAGGTPASDCSYAEQLHAQARQLGLQGLVTFAGHQRNVYDFLSTIDIAVHAAIEPEPFGRVVAEAMLSGVPNIVTIGGGPSEYMQHEVAGLHVPRNDANAMADAIEKLIESPELREQMGRSGREYALREFNPAMINEQTAELYRALLSDSSNGISKRAKIA